MTFNEKKFDNPVETLANAILNGQVMFMPYFCSTEKGVDVAYQVVVTGITPPENLDEV